MRYEIKGNWNKGYVFDVHIVASTYLGPDEHGRPQFDNTYSKMGELIHKLKYGGDKTAVPKIVRLLVRFLKEITGIENFDAIIPVPPSNKSRPFQPVDEIAKALGVQCDVKVLVGYFDKKAGGAELKNVGNPEEKIAALEGMIKIADNVDISGKRVLLLDDLYDTGATLNACCSVLQKNTKVDKVYVLTMTKTKRK